MSVRWHVAVESAGLAGSIALFECSDRAQSLVATRFLPDSATSVRTLAPTLQLLLGEYNVAASNVGLWSITSGPGSFTGLRVGLATVKMLAWASDAPVIPIDTLQAIALRFLSFANDSQSTYHASLSQGTLHLVTAINAFRKQVFTASWNIVDNQLTRASATHVLDAFIWQSQPWTGFSEIAANEKLWICGNALDSYPLEPSDQMVALPRATWSPTAEQVGQLAWQDYLAGNAISAAQLSPNYIRPSAAEEKKR